MVKTPKTTEAKEQPTPQPKPKQKTVQELYNEADPILQSYIMRLQNERDAAKEKVRKAALVLVE